MNNLRFATLTHILLLLHSFKKEWLSSEWIAGSIYINAAIVRKELSVLHKKGFVETKKGKEGGYQLKIAADKILLSDVMKMVLLDGKIIDKKNNPNPECIIGKQINEKLDTLYQNINQQVFDYLNGQTLENFYQTFNK